jgi:predicted RNase H-like HicB family nuclease
MNCDFEHHNHGVRDNPAFPIGTTTMVLTAVLTPAEEGGFVALNPETGTTTQGETVEEAIANLQEATALYLSEFPIQVQGHPLVTTFSVPAHA